ncbi:MAG: sulfurtransferase TusA family protein [Spirochaetes bacterium]|nr:sulfurtransferase TusA family protein [Spirochaetota bacterium]MBU1081875.1 sulfurtransferase TusA family protein [Spirochaetota bacterium]
MEANDDIVNVDARGRACPEPLMLAKSALARSGGKAVEVTVDAALARDNILRMAARSGREAEVRVEGELFVVRLGAAKA